MQHTKYTPEFKDEADETQSNDLKVIQAEMAKIKEFYDQSMVIYGSSRILCDLREASVS
jgi:hypothetical protein